MFSLIVTLILLLCAPFSAEAFSLLSPKKLMNYLSQVESRVTKEKDLKKKKVKIDMLSDVRSLIKTTEKKDDFFEFNVKSRMFDVRIWEQFHGLSAIGVRLYKEMTLGEKDKSLFVMSGAGAWEGISDKKKIPGGFEFISDRGYKSELAYSTKNKIRLLFYRLPKGRFVVINDQVKDYGAELQAKGVKKNRKGYGPIYYDLTIDIYFPIDKGYFQYISVSIYDGQTDKTRYESLNALKGLGNILSLGTLNKGLNSMIKTQSAEIWKKRKEAFQKLLK